MFLYGFINYLISYNTYRYNCFCICINFIMTHSVKNTNILNFCSIVNPLIVQTEYPTTEEITNLVLETRKEITNILEGKSQKILCVVGPCSIHNYDDAIEYAKRLAFLKKKYDRHLLIIMRVYFEKPRTTVGWKGFINDPDLNNTFNVNKGLREARRLLVAINAMGLPCGCEMLDPFTPQYFDDLVSWVAIGARTCESQIHRQLVSGLSMPTGFKNTTSGNVQSALDGMRAASIEHVFFGINDNGENCMIHTKGNKNTHLILRGSTSGPNYFKEFVESCPCDNIVIDCSHGNSCKNYKNQGKVFMNVLNQMKEERNKKGNKIRKIIGIMLESNLEEGNQAIELVASLKPGISVTDACISIEETTTLLDQLFQAVN